MKNAKIHKTRKRKDSMGVPWRAALKGEFRVLYFVEVALKKPSNGCDGWYLSTLPFVPHQGMFIVVVGDDNCREVEQVYWVNGRFEVFLKFEGTMNPALMMKMGWEDADVEEVE